MEATKIHKKGLTFSIILIIILFLNLSFCTFTQSIASNLPPSQSENKADNSNNLEENNKISKEQLDFLLEASAKSLNPLVEANRQAFIIFYIFIVMGIILGIFFILLMWRRESQQQRNYERERIFFEERVLSIENRQNEGQNVSLDLLKKSDERENHITRQQLKIGSVVLEKSGEMLSGQIDSIVKLGDIIGLIEETFKRQQERAEGQEKLYDKIEIMNGIVSKFTTHYKDQYEHVCALTLFFKNHSRMAWTRLTTNEENIAARARMSLETIPKFVLDDEMKKDPYKLAHIYQLLGASAFYANDVDVSLRLLEKAHEIYLKIERRPEDLYPYAFCSHFLGIIEKNWRSLDRPIESNLEEAKRHLEEANQCLEHKKGEFLTPLTLVEILSYLKRYRQEAKMLLDEKIKLIEETKSSSGLDENQHVLLGRAYILRGNLEFLDEQFEKAAFWYEQAKDHLEKNHYALLSLGQVNALINPDEKNKYFQEGLRVLESSGALKKKEDTFRIMAIAWALIASFEIGDGQREQKYLKEFDTAATYIRCVGNRERMFFCPLTKILANIRELRNNVFLYIKKNKHFNGSYIEKG